MSPSPVVPSLTPTSFPSSSCSQSCQVYSVVSVPGSVSHRTLLPPPLPRTQGSGPSTSPAWPFWHPLHKITPWIRATVHPLRVSWRLCKKSHNLRFILLICKHLSSRASMSSSGFPYSPALPSRRPWETSLTILLQQPLQSVFSLLKALKPLFYPLSADTTTFYLTEKREAQNVPFLFLPPDSDPACLSLIPTPSSSCKSIGDPSTCLLT